MALSTRLEIRQGQSLVITPQLQQAIKLLQLSNLELEAYVEGELERNRCSTETPARRPETRHRALSPPPARTARWPNAPAAPRKTSCSTPADDG